MTAAAAAGTSDRTDRHRGPDAEGGEGKGVSWQEELVLLSTSENEEFTPSSDPERRFQGHNCDNVVIFMDGVHEYETLALLFHS